MQIILVLILTLSCVYETAVVGSDNENKLDTVVTVVKKISEHTRYAGGCIVSDLMEIEVKDRDKNSPFEKSNVTYLWYETYYPNMP